MTDLLNQPLTIGSVTLRNRVLLAPMAGLTDGPMRYLAWQHGAGYTVGEMVASDVRLWRTAKSAFRRQHLDGSGPRVVQIAGFDPAAMAEVAKLHVDEGAEVIDINFGCPAKKVCKRAAGSALLAQPSLVGEIVETVVRAVNVPVTAKMRTGPDPGARNGVEVARLIEAAGAQAIAVHGRTRACRFVGAVEHYTVAEIKSRVGVPVFANGEIKSREAAVQLMHQTGVDGVMIGRAAVGRPWLLGELAGRQAPNREVQFRTMLEHLALAHGFYGEQTGTRIVRKHMEQYLTGLGYGGHTRTFNRLPSAAEQVAYVEDLQQQERRDKPHSNIELFQREQPIDHTQTCSSAC